MNFLRLNDKLLSVLFEDSEIIAIDKAYGINTHTNESKVGNTDFFQDGLIEIFEKNLKIKLYIVHRLDQTTTGVIVFAKSPESAKIHCAQNQSLCRESFAHRAKNWKPGADQIS